MGAVPSSGGFDVPAKVKCDVFMNGAEQFLQDPSLALRKTVPLFRRRSITAGKRTKVYPKDGTYIVRPLFGSNLRP